MNISLLVDAGATSHIVADKEKFIYFDDAFNTNSHTWCFTKGYRKLNHYKTYIYKNIPMKLLQNIHHTNKFLSTEFPNRTPYI